MKNKKAKQMIIAYSHYAKNLNNGRENINSIPLSHMQLSLFLASMPPGERPGKCRDKDNVEGLIASAASLCSRRNEGVFSPEEPWPLMGRLGVKRDGSPLC
jgi:hypothetical protein